MFTLRKKFTFEAAHKLPYHDGKCQRLHGHSWIGWLVVEGTELWEYGAKAGMLVDYSVLSDIVNPIVEEYLDHHYLNETLELESPTSEMIAKWIYNRVRSLLARGAAAVELVSVIIEETCTSSCEYREE